MGRSGSTRTAADRADLAEQSTAAAASSRATSTSRRTRSWRCDGMPVATPQRTAYDLGRHLPRDVAVAHLDALSRATGLAARRCVVADRPIHGGTRSSGGCGRAIDLMDGGAQSPKETWLRLLLDRCRISRGRGPRSRSSTNSDTRSPTSTWAGTTSKIAVEYDGDQHRTDRTRYAWDVKRLRLRATDRLASPQGRSPKIGHRTSCRRAYAPAAWADRVETARHGR